MVGYRYLVRAVASGARGALLALATLAVAAPGAALAAGSPVLAHATRLGAAPAGKPLPLVLPLRVDGSGLARFATAVSTPGSPQYGRYASVATLARRFGASPSARARVVRYLRAHGATRVSVDATGMLAEATMSVGLADRVFSSSLSQYRAADRTRFLAPASPPSVPAALRSLVTGVIGLDTAPVASPGVESARSLSPVAHAAQVGASSTLPLSGSPQGCPAGVAAGGANPGFTPNQYLTAYDFGPLYTAHDTGQGERVALIEIDGFSQSDVATFASCFGIPLPPIAAYGAGVPNPLPPGEEATLDIEVLSATAPGLKAIDVYESNAGASQTLAAFAAPLQKPGLKPQVISASLGLCEPDAYGASGLAGIEASERLLQLAAASGVSVFASSGDNGSSDCQSPAGIPIDTLAVNYPASSWWVTGVGGTNLSLTAANGIAAEPVWNDADVLPAGGGGGYSVLFKRPAYQRAVVGPDKRAVPDVSMLADLLPGYAIYCTAQPDCINTTSPNAWQTVGGTSAGTPLMAGGAAIIDQMLKAAGRENLGLLNPLLYQVGSSSAAPGVFYDVTQGSNDIGPFIPGGSGQPLGCCNAGPGFDAASGWGSVAMAGLAAEALSRVPKAVEVSLRVPGGQRPVAHRQVLATVSCSDACSVGAFVHVTIGRDKPFTVQSKLFRRSSRGSKTIPVRFSGADMRKLRSALADHRRIVITVYGALIDQLGAIEHDTGGKRIVAVA